MVGIQIAICQLMHLIVLGRSMNKVVILSVKLLKIIQIYYLVKKNCQEVLLE